MEKKRNIENIKEDEMKTTFSSRLLTMLLIGALVVMMPQLALATGTPVCTSVTNTATVNYNGTSVTSSSDATNTFEVANKVVPIVVTTDVAKVSIAAGATTGLLTFTVTNDGNSVQDYDLTGVSMATTTPDPFLGAQADNFDPAGFNVFVEDGTTPGYQLAEDTETFIDELAADGVATVYVVVTGAPAIALIQVAGDVAVYSLNANTHDGGVATVLGAETTNLTSTTVGPCTVPNVLADTAAGTGPDDGDLDGADSARSAFVVGATVISITKTVTTIWDPINYNVAPKAIPLALVQYVITIANDVTATASATLTTITDGLVASLAMDPDLLTDFTVPATPAAEDAPGNGFKAIVTGSTRVGSGAGMVENTNRYYTTANDADGIELLAPNITATLATVLDADTGGGTPYAAGELKPGETLTITFNAVVQ